MRNSGDEFVLKGIELRSLRKLLFILVLLLPCTAQLRRQFSRSALGAKKCVKQNAIGSKQGEKSQDGEDMHSVVEPQNPGAELVNGNVTLKVR